MPYLYYHNPRCSKSRQGLEILEKAKIKFEVKEYLNQKMTKKEVKELFTKLDIEPIDVVRTKEAIFKELDLKGKDLTQDQWAAIIVENPKLLERPILVNENKAVIGRPPENLKLLL